MALTPKETFEAVKVLWPQVTGMRKYGDRWVAWDNSGYEVSHSSTGVMVDWGKTTVYPLPEHKWRDARPGDVCQKGVDARFRDFDTNSWAEGTLLGCDFSAEYAWKCKGVGQYKYCQVRDES